MWRIGFGLQTVCSTLKGLSWSSSFEITRLLKTNASTGSSSHCTGSTEGIVYLEDELLAVFPPSFYFKISFFKTRKISFKAFFIQNMPSYNTVKVLRHAGEADSSVLLGVPHLWFIALLHLRPGVCVPRALMWKLMFNGEAKEGVGREKRKREVLLLSYQCSLTTYSSRQYDKPGRSCSSAVFMWKDLGKCNGRQTDADWEAPLLLGVDQFLKDPYFFLIQLFQ